MPVSQINEIKLNFAVHGKGEPLVLIQGWGTDQRAWIFQIHAFRKYFQVITFDNRGVGKSEKPGGRYSMKVMAADVIGLMDHLHFGVANILGLSMGGMIAQEVAINYPNRVAKLVLGCTFAYAKDGSGETEEYTKAAGGDPKKIKLALSSLANNNSMGRLFVAIWMRLNSKSWAEGFESQGSAIKDHDTRDRLHMIKSPTLVIAGTRDRVVRPSSSEYIASRIPKARLVMIENGSHSMSAENRKEFNKAVLNFLRET